jgi:hypothetical protein
MLYKVNPIAIKEIEKRYPPREKFCHDILYIRIKGVWKLLLQIEH